MIKLDEALKTPIKEWQTEGGIAYLRAAGVVGHVALTEDHAARISKDGKALFRFSSAMDVAVENLKRVKPLDPSEVFIEVTIPTEKPETEPIPTVFMGDRLRLDLPGQRFTLDNEDLRLTRTEFRLLACLAINRGRVFTRQELYSQVWDTEYVKGQSLSTVQMHVNFVRTKMGDYNREVLQTVIGTGYRFDDSHLMDAA